MKVNKIYTTASFMAVAHGREATEENTIKKYVGIAACKVIGLNPKAAELNTLLNTTSVEQDPEYVGTTTVKNFKGEDTEVPQVRLSFWVQTDPSMEVNNGIDTKLSFTIFLAKGYKYSNKEGQPLKVQVIDEFGRTAWATQEELKSKSIPMYKNGPAQISANYRPMYIGEDELVGFIKAYLGLPEPTIWDDNIKRFVERKDDTSDAQCMLDNIDQYFKGDISELKDIISYQPNNKFKALFGIRTAQNGNQYQDCYTRKFLKLGNTRYSALDAEIQKEYSEGRMANREFEACKLKVYKVTATDYSEAPTDGTNPAVDDDPFASAGGDDMPFGE